MGSQAPWRKLLSTSLETNAHLKHSKYFQLATVKLDGRAANRTVVFRGFVEGTDKIKFTTDSRTAKVGQIRANSYGEICWYFTDSWEQFRILGVLDLIDDSTTDPIKLSLRERAWFDSSIKSRSQFAGPSPRLPVLEGGPEPQVDASQGPLHSFCLVTVEAEEVDYYNLKEGKRILFHRSVQGQNQDFHWNEEVVNP